MYCEQCGAKNEPGSAFCSVCGAALAPAQPGGPSAGTASASVPPLWKNKAVKLAAAAAAVVLVIFAVSSLFGGRSDTETAEQFFDAAFDADAEAIMDLIPKDLVDAVMEESGYTRAEVEEEFESLAGQLEASIGSLDFLGDSVKISYNAVDSEDVDESRLDDLQEQYDEANVDVSAARIVTVEFRVQADSFGIDESAPFEVPVIKAGKSWYIDVISFT